ncbi:MAG: Holliday junction branch migration protein RuvA [Planctomycetes bacterium]|nr:Holliday junction branch migration protein RuvA [Planctomycetota bacterium]
MYEFISGTVSDRTPASVVIDAAGVGFELLAPIGAAFPEVGQQATVFAHLVVREDAQTLYGFARREDRNLFRVLLRVRGVGPGMALGILSGLGPSDLVAAVQREDLSAFTAIKGVGKKTAEQLMLDLRDKTPLLASLAGGAVAAPTPSAAQPAAASVEADAISALVSIGYSEKEAAKAVDKALKQVEGADLEALVKAAMRG